MKKSFIFILGAALLGLVASIILIQLHAKIGGGLMEHSFCTVSEFFDCDSVLVSPYAYIFGIPNAEIGVLYYTFVFAAILIAIFIPTTLEATLGFVWLSSVGAVLYNIFMAYISITKIGSLCIMCSLNYVASLLLLLGIPCALGIKYSEIPAFLGRYFKDPKLLPHAGAIIVFFGVGFLFFKGLYPNLHRSIPEMPKDDYLKMYQALEVKDIPTEGHPFWGNEKAKIVIAEFSDYQCPHCLKAAFTLKPYLKEFKNDVKLVVFHYPLDSACNPAIQHPMHPVSCLAAKASICAQPSGKFWEMHEKIFENQRRLSRSTLLEIAQDLKLDGPQFETCLASDETSKKLAQDLEVGGKLGIQGTPSVYINGKLFRDWGNPTRLRYALESELKKP